MLFLPCTKSIKIPYIQARNFTLIIHHLEQQEKHMNKRLNASIVSLLLGASLIGCSTFQTAPKSQTLYLDDYSKLTKVATHNGGNALVWINPDVKLQQYKTLAYQPITYYSGVSATQNVSQEVLDKVLNYTNQQVKTELAKSYSINNNAELEFKGVITKMDASTKSMQIYEALPIMMLYSGGKYLAGERELTTQIIFEGQFVDKKTNQPVVKYIQRIQGEQLDDKKSKLTVDKVKKAIDLFALDLAYIAK